MNNNRIKNGYTLVEILVGIAIFALLVAGPTGLFISSLRSQNRILGLREVVDSSSYVLEYMSRALRMAQKDSTPTGECIPMGTNYEIPTGQPKRINFLSYSHKDEKYICRQFFWDSEVDVLQLREKQSTDGKLANFGPSLNLTSPDLEVTFAEFIILGEEQNDNLQPRVTILLEMTKEAVSGFPKIKVQTTVSQRNLDVYY